MPFDPRDFWAFLLVFSRVTALVATAPVFSSAAIPRTVKVGLAGLVSLATVPVVFPHVPTPPGDLFSLAGQIGAEAAIGALLGFLANMVFAAVQIAGTVVDTQIGFAIIHVLNPYTGQPTAAIGQFYYQFALTLFLLADGHASLIGSVVGSFGVVGPGAAHFAGDVPGVLIDMMGQMFLLGFRIAVPAAAVLLVVDVSFAIVARAVPQMNVFIVGLPAKVIIGLITLSVGLPALALVLGQILPMIDTGLRAALSASR
jgi:flagellar biosynthetic protein FliR